MVDNVIAERAELNNLREFKHTFDDLNSHFLASTDEDNKMIKEVQAHLNKPADAINAFILKMARGAVTTRDFQDFASTIEAFHVKFSKESGSWDTAQQGKKAALQRSIDAQQELEEPDRVEAGWCGCARTICSRQSRTTSYSYSRTHDQDRDGHGAPLPQNGHPVQAPQMHWPHMPGRQSMSPRAVAGGYSLTPQTPSSQQKPLLASAQYGQAAQKGPLSGLSHTVE